MPQFLLVHKVIEYPKTQDEWIGIWRNLKDRACGEVEWLHSFYEPTSGKMYCEWQAPDLDGIMDCFSEEMLAQVPVVATSEIVLFDLAWLEDED